MSTGESNPSDPITSGSAAKKTGENEVSCGEDGCTKVACMDGIVLQQSWLCWGPCDEQGMLSQHCMASSGVDIAKHSNAYTAMANAITAIRIGLAKRIYEQIKGVLN